MEPNEPMEPQAELSPQVDEEYAAEIERQLAEKEQALADVALPGSEAVGDVGFVAPCLTPAPAAPVRRDGKTQADLEYEAARKVYVKEELNRQQQAIDYAAGRRPLPPVASRLRLRLDDPSVPRDAEGNDIRRLDRSYKWVPRIDMHGNEGKDNEVNMHRARGFQVTLVDGKEVVTNYGVLMEITGAERARQEMALQPVGAISAKEAFEAGREAAAAANRELGGEYLHIGLVNRPGENFTEQRRDFFPR